MNLSFNNMQAYLELVDLVKKIRSIRFIWWLFHNNFLFN